MKKSFLALMACAAIFSACQSSSPVGDGTASSTFEAEVDYDSHFTPERLRIDLVLCGDVKDQAAYLKELHRENEWAGSPNSLVDKFGYGQYFIELFEEGQLVYSKGFSTLFEEWRTTEQAETTPMAACQSVWTPFPKNKVHFVLYQRIRTTGMFESMLEFDIDPADRHIVPGPDNSFAVTSLLNNGESAHKVDLVFAGEGYTEAQLPKLREDAMKITDYIFSMEPYASRKDDFNIWLVESVSEEQGSDIPQDGIWHDTLMDSMFDTFYIDRYLTVTDQTKIASVVSGAPVDAIFVIVNDSKYGGAGMYGSYAMGTSDHRLSLPVTIHEFGHSFAGLGDEYYDSEVAYSEDYYPAGIEPWEPNVTTLVDFDSKWKDMMEEGTPMPTPNDSSYTGIVGCFEGAGYMTYGCYRPYYECRMLNNTAPGFCPVCQRAINRMIDNYVK